MSTTTKTVGQPCNRDGGVEVRGVRGASVVKVACYGSELMSREEIMYNTYLVGFDGRHLGILSGSSGFRQRLHRGAVVSALSRHVCLEVELGAYSVASGTSRASSAGLGPTQRIVYEL